MKKISAQDIDQINLFGEAFNRALVNPATSGDPEKRFEDAKAVIDRIIAHADKMIDVNADNVVVAMRSVTTVLNQSLTRLENSGVVSDASYIPEMRRVANSYNPDVFLKIPTLSFREKEVEFCEKIDARVAEFNRIAAQEILQEPPVITELDGIDSIGGAIAAESEAFKEDLEKTTFPAKLEALKEAFRKIADLGMEAVQEVALTGADANYASVEAAIQRLTHVLDVMSNDELDYAPELVRSDALYKDEQWQPLRDHRDKVSDQLREQLSSLIERQSPTMA